MSNIALYRVLVGVGADKEEAQAAADSIPDKENLTTKEDLQKSFGEVKAEISGLRGEVKAEISGLRGEVKTEISSLRGEVKADMAVLKYAYGPVIVALLIKIAFFS